MKVTENIKFTKSEYTLKDLGMFKLCPCMYALSIMHPDLPPISGAQRRLKIEAEILLQTLMMISAKGKIYFKGTSQFLADMADCFGICLKGKNFKELGFTLQETELIANGLYDKAQRISDDIHRWIKGSQYIISKGIRKCYPMGMSSFVYTCSFRAIDTKNDNWRSVNADEYLDFPVISTGKKSGFIIRYKDIMELLSGNDTSADRIGAVIKMIRKINTQFEIGYYEDDGIKRVAQLINDIENHDFSQFCKKPSGFCEYCKYFDKCRQFL